jgi:hypothetical protein
VALVWIRESCVMDGDVTWRTIGLIGVSEDEYAFTLGVAQSAADGPALLMMCDVGESGPQEVGLAMDTYCLVRDDQAGTFYGGVKQVDLDRDSLAVRFHPDAARELAVDEYALWTLAVSDSDYELLAHGLRRVFRFGREDQHPVLRGV